jgi:hypothetical protein
MVKRPSIIKIIIVDYVALLATLFPAVMWGMYLFLVVLKNIQPVDMTFLAIDSVVTLVSLIVLIWRIRQFFALFSDGLAASATISNVSFFRDRGRVDYIFNYQGQKYASGNAIHKVKQTENLKVGDEVIVIVDRNNPKRAYIRDLYV